MGAAYNLSDHLDKAQIGFTGTSGQTTIQQREALTVVLAGMGGLLQSIVLHHGDCIHADADAHDIAVSLGIPIILHPPDNPSKRAWKTEGVIMVLSPKPYLVRNQWIVESTQSLIAMPNKPERLHSGTWSTIRYARRRRKTITIIWPDGGITGE